MAAIPIDTLDPRLRQRRRGLAIDCGSGVEQTARDAAERCRALTCDERVREFVRKDACEERERSDEASVGVRSHFRKTTRKMKSRLGLTLLRLPKIERMGLGISFSFGRKTLP